MDRQEITRRLQLLKEQQSKGEVHVDLHLRDDFERSLSRVKFASDGLVDETSLDGRVRSYLAAVAYSADREEWKSIVSLKQIQEAYFDRISNMFDQPYRLMREANADPYSFAGWFASEGLRVKETIQTIDNFVESVQEFWGNIADPTWIHLEDSSAPQAIFTGEIFPDGQSNVVSSTGIYFDTTILPDPFLKIAPVLPLMGEAERVQEILRLGLQAISYRELALADFPTPIVAVLPDRHSLEDNYREFIFDGATRSTLQHASILFDRSFSSIDDLTDFLQHFTSSTEIVSALSRPEELVFATEWEGNLASHIDRYLIESSSKLNITQPGQAVFAHLVSRFSQATDSYQRSRELRATPIVRAETSWLWFNWMLRNNAMLENSESLVGLHMARALGKSAKSELSWLGNVPPAALIEIRKAGALEEIRALMSVGVAELVAARPDNFFRTGDKVFENLDSALHNHEAKLRELREKKWKFAGFDIGSFLVVGGIEMTAALTGIPLFGAAAATTSILGVTPTAKDLKERYGKLREESKALTSSGVGILFKLRGA